MISNRVSAPAVWALLGLFAGAGQAVAQTSSSPSSRPDRPYRGLFGSGLDNTEQSLVASGSLGGGYDSNIIADLQGGGSGAGGANDPRTARRGAVGSVSASLAYSLTRGRVDFGASFGEASRYYPGNSQTLIHSYNETVGINYRATRRTTVTANQFVAYQPFVLSSLFPSLYDAQPGQLSLPPVDLATGLSSYVTYGANAGVNHQLARRVTFTGGYNVMRSDTPYVNASLSQQGGNAGLRFGLTRNIGLRTGYGRQEGRYAGSSDPVVSETYDIGLDFQKALSISRRTTVSFSSGTSAIASTQSDTRNRTFFVTGLARLNHEIGRSWIASAAYDRSVQFIEVLLRPVLADSFNAGLNGFITRQLEFSSGVQGSIGSIGFGNDELNQGYSTYQAFTSLAYAFSRWANVNVSYSYYQYRFEQDTSLPLGIARDFDRQSVRANLNLWAPLMKRTRRK